MDFQEYGIMLPIAPDRGKRILESLGKNYVPSARGDTMPYPGPVFSITDALVHSGSNNMLTTREDLERIHCKEFIASLYGGSSQKNRLKTAMFTTYELIDSHGCPNRYEPQRAKKPLSELFQTILVQVSGTWLACCLALAEGPGFCYYLGGGMHHARFDSGSGFCLVNDIAIAAVKILNEKPLRLIWIIDLDVHKGDGTAELISFARQREELLIPAISHEKPVQDGTAKEKPCILTLSIHMARGWPLDTENLRVSAKDRAPNISSDIDIGIESGEEKEYTLRLAQGIRELERLSAALYLNKQNNVKPDLVMVVDGADTYEHDELPSSNLLNLTLEQCLERDNYVYRYLMDRSIPSAWIQSGGYGSRAWEPPAYFLQGVR
jgi:acetoin utilization deacetylase AcuC-like enzyme